MTLDPRTLARALGGEVAGRNSVSAPGPGHSRKDRSLSIRVDPNVPDGFLVHSHAGDDWVVCRDYVRSKLGLPEWQPGAEQNRRGPPTNRRANDRTRTEEDLESIARATNLWNEGRDPQHTVVEDYLRHRGITLPVPPSLRCGSRQHLDRYHMPVMVAGVQRSDGKLVAVQTTLLTTAGKKATVSTPRITTGTLGAGAVRLAKAGDVLGIAEGVESALSAMQLSGVSTWACLGAGRMHRVAIPDTVRELHIFGDNDEPGSAAAERTAHENRHRRVVLRFPPLPHKDWNDLLARAEGIAA